MRQVCGEPRHVRRGETYGVQVLLRRIVLCLHSTSWRRGLQRFASKLDSHAVTFYEPSTGSYVHSPGCHCGSYLISYISGLCGFATLLKHQKKHFKTSLSTRLRLGLALDFCPNQ